MHSPLKLAIFLSGKTQREISEATGIDAVTLSRIVNGRRLPSDDDRKLIAKALGRPERELFSRWAVSA